MEIFLLLNVPFSRLGAADAEQSDPKRVRESLRAIPVEGRTIVLVVYGPCKPLRYYVTVMCRQELGQNFAIGFPVGNRTARIGDLDFFEHCIFDART